MQNLWASLRQGAASGVLAGGFPYANNNWFTGAGAPQFGRRADTLQDVLDDLEDNDLVFVPPGELDENLTLTGKNRVALIGASSPFGARVTALTNGVALTIGDAQDVLLQNLNLEGRGTGGAVKLTGQVRRLTLRSCKLSGGAFAFLIASASGGQSVEVFLDDCYIFGVTTGISNAIAGGDPTHRLMVRGCRFFAVTTDCIVSAGSAINTMIQDSYFGNDGDTEPTRFIKLDGAGDSGLVAGNQFATPTNANTKFVLDADVLWGANATEAGWSTARPA